MRVCTSVRSSTYADRDREREREGEKRHKQSSGSLKSESNELSAVGGSGCCGVCNVSCLEFSTWSLITFIFIFKNV